MPTSEWARTGEDWTHIANRPPPANVQLETISDGGISATLILWEGGWWTPDLKTQVFYTPKFWRRITERYDGGGT